MVRLSIVLGVTTQKYWYVIIAHLLFKIIICLSVCTVTSEVQGVEVCTDEKSFFIRCIFFTNTSVSGCNYVLEGVSNISGHIARGNSQGTRVEVNDVSSYSKIIVYDAVSQTDISNRDIGIRESLQNMTKCLATDFTSGGFTHSLNSKLILLYQHWMLL